MKVLVDQVLGVRIREGANGADALVARGSVEAGMDGGDDVGGLSEVLGEKGSGEGAATAVKHEHWAAGSEFLNLKHDLNCISTCLYTQADKLDA